MRSPVSYTHLSQWPPAAAVRRFGPRYRWCCSPPVLKGYKATAYPAVGPDVTLAGGEYVEVPVDQAVVDKNLVTAPAWPADTAICREFAKLLGAKIEI